MDNLEQLEKWVEGVSVHNTTTGECCPDFSCCNINYKAPKEERVIFAAAYKEDPDSPKVHEMLLNFLGHAYPPIPREQNVHIAGNTPDQTH